MTVDAILSVMRDNGISPSGAIIENPHLPEGFFIPIQVSRNADGTRHPSKKLLSILKIALNDLDIHPEFVVVDEQSKEAEKSLKLSTMLTYPEQVKNIILSVENMPPQVWVELIRALPKEEAESLSKHINTSLNLFRIPSANINILHEIDLPTKYELLSAIRIHAPISVDTLREILSDRGFTELSTDWITRQLDSMRKAKLLSMRGDRKYVLTFHTIQRLGTSKNRESPDVRRLLALAKGVV